MPGSIPLIRASAIAPFLRWMRANGRPVDTLLRGSASQSFPSTTRPAYPPAGPLSLCPHGWRSRRHGPSVSRGHARQPFGHGINRLCRARRQDRPCRPDSRHDRDAGPHDPRNDHGQTGLRLHGRARGPGNASGPRDATILPAVCGRTGAGALQSRQCQRTRVLVHGDHSPSGSRDRAPSPPFRRLGCRSPGPGARVAYPDHVVTGTSAVPTGSCPLSARCLTSRFRVEMTPSSPRPGSLWRGSWPGQRRPSIRLHWPPAKCANLSATADHQGHNIFATGGGCPPRKRHRRTGRRPHIGKRHCRVARLPASIIADAGGAPMVGQHATQRASPHGPA